MMSQKLFSSFKHGTYLSVSDNGPLSEVVPHPETTNIAPSGMDIAEDGKETGEALKQK